MKYFEILVAFIYIIILPVGCSSDSDINKFEKFRIKDISIGMDVSKLKNITCDYSPIEGCNICYENGAKYEVRSLEYHGFLLFAGVHSNKIYQIIYSWDSNDVLLIDSKFGISLTEKYGKPLIIKDGKWKWFNQDNEFLFSAYCDGKNSLHPTCNIMAFSSAVLNQDLREKENEETQKRKISAEPPPKF